MALPKYDKSKRKTHNYMQLPKGAYVITIRAARMDHWPSGDEYISMAFDIAEGEHKGFYQTQFDNDTRDEKKWPYDAVFNLNVPTDSSESWVHDNYNTFFADLEDSNGGFQFAGDIKALRGKVIGAKFYNKQSEKDGTVYDHIVPKAGWTCIADDVRAGKAGKLPNDKLITSAGSSRSRSAAKSSDGFMDIPDGTEEELPF